MAYYPISLPITNGPSADHICTLFQYKYVLLGAKKEFLFFTVDISKLKNTQWLMAIDWNLYDPNIMDKIKLKHKDLRLDIRHINSLAYIDHEPNDGWKIKAEVQIPGGHESFVAKADYNIFSRDGEIEFNLKSK